MKIFFLMFFLSLSLFVLAQEGQEERRVPHAEEQMQGKIKGTAEGGRPTSWTEWIGTLHLIFLHFPITLINPDFRNYIYDFPK